MEKKNILLLTTMYPDPLRPGTDVCHYYAKEWVKKGHRVIVFNLRSMFPSIYTYLAGLFPGLAHRYIGNHVEMDRNMNIIQHQMDDVQIYSVPIFKYLPHRKYPHKSILNTLETICSICEKNKFVPNAILGHFYNPCVELIFDLKKIYPESKTSIVFHESNIELIRKNYSHIQDLLNTFDIVGGRHMNMVKILNNAFGPFKHPFVCVSGTNELFLKKPLKNKVFTNDPLKNFLYVGQFTANKCVKENIVALNSVYGKNSFHLNCIGGGGNSLEVIKSYIYNQGIKDKVSFINWIEREKLIEFYDQSDCFLMISKSEAFGLVYLEAMSRGCICIGTEGQGIDGVIIDGYNGFLCEGGNVNELESIIRNINSLPAEEKKRISNNAIITAKKFSDENVALNYIENVFEPSSHNLVNF